MATKKKESQPTDILFCNFRPTTLPSTRRNKYSKYLGVTFVPGERRWKAVLNTNSIQISRSFKTEIEAAIYATKLRITPKRIYAKFKPI